MSSIPTSNFRSAIVASTLCTALACGGDKAEDAGRDSTVAGATASTNAPIVLGPQDITIARSAEIGTSLILSGPLEPKHRVTVRSQIPGIVQSLRVDRGTPVRRGQVLATIRAEGVQSQAAGARAAVAAANANLAVARQRLEAARTLRQAGAMSEIDLRSAQAAFESAEAQVAAARAQAASAGETAGFATIVSPIAGIVSDRMVDQGEAVNPGADMLTVVDARMLELRAQLGVGDASRVRVGQPVTFTLDAFPGQNYQGRVARIDPIADPGTRQVNVYVELANPTGRIIGGQFARGRITMAATRSIVIPASAVQGAGTDGSGAHVFVIRQGRINRRPVTLGARDEATGAVAVLTGLNEGEQVVANPTTDLRDGTIVTVSTASASAAAPASGSAKQE
jgi:membrane fusion protein, multidrug efflux system